MPENHSNEKPRTAGDYYSHGGIEEVKKRFFQRNEEGNSRPYKVLEERAFGVNEKVIAINYIDEDGKPINDAFDWITQEQHINHQEYIPKICLEATLKLKKLSD